MQKRLKIKPVPSVEFVNLEHVSEPNERDFYIKELYDMLEEREPNESISHKEMPTFEDHRKFVMTFPYKEWHMLLNKDGQVVGQLYVTDENHIGITIFRQFREQGYARAALEHILGRYETKDLIANINPKNAKSKALFRSLGFKLIQYTYQKKAI